MKKLMTFVLLFLVSSVLSAGVFELFHPNVSYYERCNILSKEIIGPFSLLSPPAVSKNTKIYDEDCYFFYDAGRYMSYYIEGKRERLMLFIDIFSFTYDFETGEVGGSSSFIEYVPDKTEDDGVTAVPLLSQIYSMSHTLLPSYRIEEQTDDTVVIRSTDGDVVIAYRDYGSFAVKTIEKDGKLVYARWILASREVNGERIPTREAFYLPYMDGDTVYFKESLTTAGYGVDYGPFDYNGLSELGEKIRSIL